MATIVAAPAISARAFVFRFMCAPSVKCCVHSERRGRDTASELCPGRRRTNAIVPANAGRNRSTSLTSRTSRVGRRVVQAAFDGGDIVSDGGVLLLKRVDERLGLTRAAAQGLGD